MSGPPFAIARISKQFVHKFRVSVRRFIIQESVSLVGRGRFAHEVGVNAAQQGDSGGGRRGLHAFRFQFRQHKGINGIFYPRGIFYFRGGISHGRRVGPHQFHGVNFRALIDPRFNFCNLRGVHRRSAHRHPGRNLPTQVRNNRAVTGVAGNNDRLAMFLPARKQRGYILKRKSARMLVGAVARRAVGLQKRFHVLMETDRSCSRRFYRNNFRPGLLLRRCPFMLSAIARAKRHQPDERQQNCRKRH